MRNYFSFFLLNSLFLITINAVDNLFVTRFNPIQQNFNKVTFTFESYDSLFKYERELLIAAPSWKKIGVEENGNLKLLSYSIDCSQINEIHKITDEINSYIESALPAEMILHYQAPNSSTNNQKKVKTNNVCKKLCNLFCFCKL